MKGKPNLNIQYEIVSSIDEIQILKRNENEPMWKTKSLMYSTGTYRTIRILSIKHVCH